MENVKDIDGNSYKTVKIGRQILMAENLKVTHYQNGDKIPNFHDNDDWRKLDKGAYCVYDNNENNANIYGRLYNWFAVNDKRNLAPKGWRIPTDFEWIMLEIFLGLRYDEHQRSGWRGHKLGAILKDFLASHFKKYAMYRESGHSVGTKLMDYLNQPNEEFNTFLGGTRYANGEFHDLRFNGDFWSYPEASYHIVSGRNTGSNLNDDAWYRRLDNSHSGIFRENADETGLSGCSKRSGKSVLCIKGSEAIESPLGIHSVYPP